MAHERMKRDQGEMKFMTQQVNKALKDNKMTLPLTKDEFIKLCKALNMHCTERLAFEGLIYCMGKNIESTDPEDFDFERLIAFLHMKSKVVAPADNPNFALTTKTQRNLNY